MSNDRLLDGRLKLRHLSLVVQIADQGTVVGAARALHVTQPVVTRALREVEEILGVQLFERGSRGVTPTLFGETFLDHARAVIAQLRQAGQQIDLLTNADLGTVTVGTHLAGVNLLLPRAIKSLKDVHPLLTVVVREATPDVLYTALLTGDCDVMVGRLTPRGHSELTQRLLYREPIRLATRADHPVHAGECPTLQELAETYPWVLPVEQTALRGELENYFLQEGIRLPENRIECTSMPLLAELLVTTDFIAALPMLVASRHPNLALIPIALESIGQSVGITWPENRPLSPATKAMIQHLRKHASWIDSDLRIG